MNELQLLESKGTMTSLEIAEITGKEHYNVLRDIKDEISKLGTERAWVEWVQRYNRSKITNVYSKYTRNITAGSKIQCWC